MTLSTSRTPTLEEVIRAAIETRLLEVHTALPGRVETYDAARQKASVKPLLKRSVVRSDGSDFAETLPIIPDVPVVFPRGGGFFLSLPMQPGDFVLLLFSESSIDTWQTGAGEETALLEGLDLRRHDLSDAVALAGWYPDKRALASASPAHLVVGADAGKQVHVKTAEIALGIENPADFVALAAKVLTELQNIKLAFDLHTHSGVTTGTAASGPPSAPLPPPQPVASAVVRSE